MMHANLHQLNKRFGIDDVLRFSAGEGGLWRAAITTDKCVAEIYRDGAHLTRWRPIGCEDVLWLSAQARFEYAKAIRGGVPICFPWFADNQPDTDPDGPAHGYARITPWQFTDATYTQGDLTLTLINTIHPFALTYRVTFGDTLTMALTVANTSNIPATFEAALHTYFTISQIRQVRVFGLENADYLDTVGGNNKPRTQNDQPVTFNQEIDRTYTSDAAVRIEDPGLARSILIDKTGSDSTVVWNPWLNKARAMADFGDDEWPGMLCVETANAQPHAVTLDPAESHTMTATLRVLHH